jgi:hypothetical protein
MFENGFDSSAKEYLQNPTPIAGCRGDLWSPDMLHIRSRNRRGFAEYS